MSNRSISNEDDREILLESDTSRRRKIRDNDYENYYETSEISRRKKIRENDEENNSETSEILRRKKLRENDEENYTETSEISRRNKIKENDREELLIEAEEAAKKKKTLCNNKVILIKIYFGTVFDLELTKEDLCSQACDKKIDIIVTKMRDYMINSLNYTDDLILNKENFGKYFLFQVTKSNGIDILEFNISSLKGCVFYKDLNENISIAIIDIYKKKCFVKEKHRLNVNKDFCYVQQPKVTSLYCIAKIDWNKNLDKSVKDKVVPFLRTPKNYPASATKYLKTDDAQYPENFTENFKNELKKLNIDGKPYVHLCEELYTDNIFNVTNHKGDSKLDSANVHLIEIDKWKYFTEDISPLHLINNNKLVRTYKIEAIVGSSWDAAPKFNLNNEPAHGLTAKKNCLFHLENKNKYFCAFLNDDVECLNEMNKSMNASKVSDVLCMMFRDKRIKIEKGTEISKEVIKEYIKMIETDITEVKTVIKCLENFFDPEPQYYVIAFIPYQLSKYRDDPIHFKITDIYQTGYKSNINNISEVAIFDDPFLRISPK